MIYQEMNLDYGFMILFKKITKLLLKSSNAIIVIINLKQMKRKNPTIHRFCSWFYLLSIVRQLMPDSSQYRGLNVF